MKIKKLPNKSFPLLFIHTVDFNIPYRYLNIEAPKHQGGGKRLGEISQIIMFNPDLKENTPPPLLARPQ